MNNKLENFHKLVDVIEKLRSPEGCPWDREQTHYTLRENLLEETYEAIDAIDSGDLANLKEELGDILLQVVLHAQIASEENKFDINDVSKSIAEKLIRRHPHVFSDVTVENSQEVMKNWEEIKKKEKPERTSALSGVVKSLPALKMAYELSKKAVKVGFEWPNLESLWDCYNSEVQEFKEAADSKIYDDMEDEFGDILFSLVNVARWYKINPELALLRANKKFKTRFQQMEKIATKNMKDCSIDELEELWQSAKNKLENID